MEVCGGGCGGGGELFRLLKTSSKIEGTRLPAEIKGGEGEEKMLENS